MGAFRYVFKNNLEAEISEAVASIISKLDNWTDNQEKITLKCRTSGVLENVTMKKTDIVFLQTEKTRRVTLKTTYSEYELLVKPLSEYAELLDPSVFVPIMRSYLLNFNHVEAIEAGSFILTGGLTVPLGIKREARNASMEKYLKFLEERI
ncbi:LytTR family DNA-binding domain-containing protein [Enterococcus malodoratus]|uniref:LytTR family DNA-binding domain-containing protein n=1 Tax=Enterococcus malodoratus TaxID=71451 RepID=UPI0020738E05|nr:LytTR family DNA-binding domain-containing protein [Enterococcus malodoratus]